MVDTNQNGKPRFGRKPGRTLLVQKTSDSFNSSVLEGLEGLTATHHTERSNSYFLTFETLPHSLSAYRDLKANHIDNLRVKFAHYRVFFTLQGLTSESDYSQVKTSHTELITNLGGSVLFYKLYRKEGSFLGSGDLTIDTKDTFDMLVNNNTENKEFSLVNGDVTFTGIHYRYNRRRNDTDQGETGSTSVSASV